MEFKGFVGGAYLSQARVAAVDECINFYVEKIESETAPSDAMLVGTPGLAVFAALPTSPVQGCYEILDRAFAVAGGTLYEIFKDGTYIARGQVFGAGVALFTSNNVQLVVAVNNRAWVLTLGSNVLTEVTGAMSAAGVTGISSLDFFDGYVVVSSPNTRQFNLSALLDATQWNGLDFGIKEGGADNLLACIVNQRVLWLLGARTSEVWWDSGNPNFPLQYIQGSFVEKGCAAALSPAQFDNTVAWLGRDKRGAAIVYKANGYTPQRISTHALEFAMSTYPRIDDAIGSSHQYRGHEFYRLDFPSACPAAPNGTPAGRTWLCDAATGFWHERLFWNTQFARYEAHRGRFYCFAFGKHLMGDYATGNIYEMDAAYLDDFGHPLRSVRTAPHQYSEGKRIAYSQLIFDMQVGAGLPNGALPQAALQLSNDGGNRWGNEWYESLGPLGSYTKQVKFRRLAQARDRVIRLIISDPVPRAIVGAYFEASVGSS